MSKLVIVIVNWNTGRLLARCLRSLQCLPEIGLIDEVIVVDNASTDKSLVEAQVVVGKNINKPRVRFLKQNSNTGFARANNIAIASLMRRLRARTNILLLNPDTEVRAGALTNMLRVLEEKEKTGVVGPRLFNDDGSAQLSVRAFPTFAVFVFLLLKLNRLLPAGKLWKGYMRHDFDYTRQSEVDQVMGAAFLIRGELIETIGFLDEGFWVWFEEVDYCKRAKEAGWKIVYTPKAEIVHHGAASFNRLVGFKRSLPWLKSLLHYSRKHMKWYENLALWLLVPINITLMVPAMFWHFKQKNYEE